MVCYIQQKEVYQSTQHLDNLFPALPKNPSQGTISPLNSISLEEDLNYVRSVIKKLLGTAASSWFDIDNSITDLKSEFNVNHIGTSADLATYVGSQLGQHKTITAWGTSNFNGLTNFNGNVKLLGQGNALEDTLSLAPQSLLNYRVADSYFKMYLKTDSVQPTGRKQVFQYGTKGFDSILFEKRLNTLVFDAVQIDDELTSFIRTKFMDDTVFFDNTLYQDSGIRFLDTTFDTVGEIRPVSNGLRFLFGNNNNNFPQSISFTHYNAPTQNSRLIMNLSRDALFVNATIWAMSQIMIPSVNDVSYADFASGTYQSQLYNPQPNVSLNLGLQESLPRTQDIVTTSGFDNYYYP